MIDNYLNKLEDRFSAYFDTKRNFTFNGINYDMLATYFERNEHYIAVKKAVVWDYETYQHILVKHIESVDLDTIKKFTKSLEDFVKEQVIPTDSHMSTLVRGLIITEGEIPQDVINYIRKYKFYKSFSFGFKGWVNIALNLLDINNIENGYYNKRGKEDSKNFIISL
ncbi:hypothetical protein LV469_02695 [Peptoniphilus sp. GNH]|nr:hypothetical protein HMPREF3189_01599 [Clostridiales bacterium KA00134]UHR03214.1 hypothetical protein LV469_02695 [Peptoniphilus sp. GNH]